MHHRTIACWLGERAQSVDLNSDKPIIADWERVTQAIALATSDALQSRISLTRLDDQIALAVLVLLHPILEQQDTRHALLNNLPFDPLRPLYIQAVEVHARLCEEQS
jgi:hypothetical protein